MKLLTKAILKSIPHLGATETHKDPMVRAKLFGGSATWWIIERSLQDHDTLFGLVDLGMGFRELGNFSLRDLEALRFPPFGLPIERDRFFTPCPLSGLMGGLS